MYNDEDMPFDGIGAYAININDGMKAIVYLDTATIQRMVEQMNHNNGQLDHTTAMAVASSVAAAVKALHNDNWAKLRANEHRSIDRGYDFEEEDDPRTLFDPEEE